MEAQLIFGLQAMVQQCGVNGVNKVEIEGRYFWVRPVSHHALRSGNVVETDRPSG